MGYFHVWLKITETDNLLLRERMGHADIRRRYRNSKPFHRAEIFGQHILEIPVKGLLVPDNSKAVVFSLHY